jgi:hypothetical protein
VLQGRLSGVANGCNDVQSAFCSPLGPAFLITESRMLSLSIPGLAISVPYSTNLKIIKCPQLILFCLLRHLITLNRALVLARRLETPVLRRSLGEDSKRGTTQASAALGLQRLSFSTSLVPATVEVVMNGPRWFQAESQGSRPTVSRTSKLQFYSHEDSR